MMLITSVGTQTWRVISILIVRCVVSSSSDAQSRSRSSPTIHVTALLFHIDIPDTHRILDPDLGGGALLDLYVCLSSCVP